VITSSRSHGAAAVAAGMPQPSRKPRPARQSHVPRHGSTMMAARSALWAATSVRPREIVVRPNERVGRGAWASRRRWLAMPAVSNPLPAFTSSGIRMAVIAAGEFQDFPASGMAPAPDARRHRGLVPELTRRTFSIDGTAVTSRSARSTSPAWLNAVAQARAAALAHGRHDRDARAQDQRAPGAAEIHELAAVLGFKAARRRAPHIDRCAPTLPNARHRAVTPPGITRPGR